MTVVRALGENEDSPVRSDEDGCPDYSDKAIIDMRDIEAWRVSLSIGG